MQRIFFQILRRCINRDLIFFQRTFKFYHLLEGNLCQMRASKQITASHQNHQAKKNSRERSFSRKNLFFNVYLEGSVELQLMKLKFFARDFEEHKCIQTCENRFQND